MDITTLLKKFQHIKPDPGYSERSRTILLAQLPDTRVRARRPSVGALIWQSFGQSIEFGSAVAFASLLFMLFVGGYSLWDRISPFKFESLDPVSLHAEAEAIDIQIEITSLNYAEPFLAPLLPERESTAPIAEAVKTPVITEKAREEARTLGITPPADATSSARSIGVDEALDALAK